MKHMHSGSDGFLEVKHGKASRNDQIAKCLYMGLAKFCISIRICAMSMVTVAGHRPRPTRTSGGHIKVQ
jgi:hypothetical protein